MPARSDVDFDALRESWPGQAGPICRELTVIVTRLEAASVYTDDSQFSVLIREISAAIQCLIEMVGVMVWAMEPAVTLDESALARIQESWRDIIRADFDDLCINASRLGKIAQRANQPKLTECVDGLVKTIDRMGDTLTVKFFLNGDSVHQLDRQQRDTQS